MSRKRFPLWSYKKDVGRMDSPHWATEVRRGCSVERVLAHALRTRFYSPSRQSGSLLPKLRRYVTYEAHNLWDSVYVGTTARSQDVDEVKGISSGSASTKLICQCRLARTAAKHLAQSRRHTISRDNEKSHSAVSRTWHHTLLCHPECAVLKHD